MPIQKRDRIVRQYHADVSGVDAESFLNLVETCVASPVLSPIVKTNVTLQYGDTQVTGDVAEVRSLLPQVPDDDNPLSFSANIQANTNPRRTLSISVSFAQGLATFTLQNASGAQWSSLVRAFGERFPERDAAATQEPQPVSQPTESADVDSEYLPGAFRPVPMPEKSDRHVFVVMSFNRVQRDAFNLAIGPTLRRLGFEPVRVDEIQHNNTVTPEIMRQIERSVFVVADLTGERPNVYYEVGYAHRADKEVVLAAKKDTAVHFDVAAINRIVYEDYTELADALEKRVRGIADRLGLSVGSGGAT